MQKQRHLRKSKDDYYIDIALAVSSRSTCNWRQYGCVIVKDDKIVATGYNGSERGNPIHCSTLGICNRLKDVAEKTHANYDKCIAVHAEQNALIQGNRNDLIGATVYLACKEWDDEDEEYIEDYMPVPCKFCVRMLKNAQIACIKNRNGEISI